MDKKIKTIKAMISKADNADEKKALKAALRALNKQKPRPPLFESAPDAENATHDDIMQMLHRIIFTGNAQAIYCPACDCDLSEYHKPQNFEYCPICGQALEWEKYFDKGLEQ